MNIIAIIPSRYASSRFPGKPLALVKGIPMIVRVFAQAKKVFTDVCVATDDKRIYDIVTENGGVAVMTKQDHKSGTDRCLEALHKYEEISNKKFDIVLNIQGDEPFISPNQLQSLKECFKDETVEIATLVKPAEEMEEVLDSNRPKVVLNKDNFAIYFSRSVIPHYRAGNLSKEIINKEKYYLHIGLYGYRKEILEQICKLEEGYLERIEKLEQLRWLENGIKIKVEHTQEKSYCIDTQQDLERINNMEFL